MKRILILLLFLLAMICQDIVFAQIPLQIGNRWDFVEHQWDAFGYSKLDTVSINIYADTLIGGIKYYRVSNNPWIFDFVRSDTVGIYYYDALNNNEWLFFKYKQPVGEYIQNGYHLPLNDTTYFIKVYKVIDDTTSCFGQLMRRMRYSIEKSIDNVSLIDITFQLGFYYIDESNISENVNIGLSGCKIGNKIYGVLTAVENMSQIPRAYKLFQNYPNPFNPTTIIEYLLPKEEIVTLKVYDILGQEVRTLLKEVSQNSGLHQITFSSNELPSGIYLYNLIIKGNSTPLIGKMVLIK